MSEAKPQYDIVARDVDKSFGSNHVLRKLNLRVRRGETFVILGPSGTGKSVFLKHVIGLMAADAGEILVFGQKIYDLPMEEQLRARRRIGMVFQSSALLNSLTVEENVALGLVENGIAHGEELRRTVNEKLALVNMQGTNDRLPEQISGGMKKRVAVARTLALEPEMILFDEPTTGLDPVMADNVDELILGLKASVGCTSVVVTHDMISAFRVADRIGMFHEGRILHVAPPDEFRRSDEKVIQDFIAREMKWRA